MVKGKGTLEHSIPIILIHVALTLLSFKISIRISFLIQSIIFLAIEILLKNDKFYKKYIKILFYIDYDKYLNNDYYNKQKRVDQSPYFLCGIFCFIRIFLDRSIKGKMVYNRFFIYWISLCIIILLNSIIGVCIYKKFKNKNQYKISFYIFIFLIVLNPYLIIFLV